MPPLNCRDFFAWHACNPEIVKELQKRPVESLSWESATASDHSPGPVTQEETLYRQVVQPLHVDQETNTLRPVAFSDVANKGLSVDRLKHQSIESMLDAGKRRVAGQVAASSAQDQRRLYGLAELRVADIRNIVDAAGRRAFAVFDTARCDNASHADVCQLVDGKQSGRSVRSKLIDAATKMIVA